MTDSSTTDSPFPAGISYKDAGVDIEAGSALVERIKHVARQTHRPEMMTGLGGFGALCELPAGYKQPVLVSGTDGVGTKLRLAMDLGQHDTIGIDLVAMCVNDLIVSGAEPLFFLDYYATGKLNIDVAADVIKGIAKGCLQSGCTLAGGETAEMPGMYQGEDYDLAGFCVGVVEKQQIIDGHRVSAGDVLMGVASSGPHSNGYSLIRKILDVHGIRAGSEELDQDMGGVSLQQALMSPTRIYVRALLSLIQKMPVHALCHITGGGLLENLPRVLPEHTRAVIDTASWEMPPVFRWLQRMGNVASTEMLRTFNCGVGMVICVAKAQQAQVIEQLAQAGEQAWLLGHIEEKPADSAAVVLK